MLISLLQSHDSFKLQQSGRHKMAVRMTFISYTIEANMSIIEKKQNREPAMRALVEEAGGNFLGFYGMIGQEHDAVIISDFDELTDYLSVVVKGMAGGAISDVKTGHCYTGEDVVAATTKAAGLEYTPPTE